MSNFTPLDPASHQDIRVITDRGADYGENIHLVPVVADELRQLVLEYPVCLLKDPNTGQFGMHALLGFEPGNNLFLQAERWQANYIPLHIRRQPFMVAVNGPTGTPATPENTVVTIDMNHPRVTQTGGESLFSAEGEPSEYTRQISSLLAGLIPAVIRTERFVEALVQHQLIEAVQFTVNLADGSKQSFGGLYTINEEALAQLSEQQVMEFHQQGYFQACHLLLASIGNIQKLVTLQSQRR
ncbi:peptidase [Neiella marina]|uniref:Peptidase n=1 Tax=Neiella marina TaxID=508461 RepID=A0A8J2XQ40_9GAMM|nr:SapC family protein [Neiella marina]GGA81529.1 peptidase [Neiella marina]